MPDEASTTVNRVALAAVIDRVGVPMSWSDLEISLRAIGEQDGLGGGSEFLRAELDIFGRPESMWVVCPAIDPVQEKFRYDFATLSTWPIDSRILVKGDGRFDGICCTVFVGCTPCPLIWELLASTWRA